MITSSIGYRIKQIRKTNKLTQAEIGKILGVTGPWISNIEKHNKIPSDQFLISFAQKFKVSKEWLKTGKAVDYIAIQDTVTVSLDDPEKDEPGIDPVKPDPRHEKPKTVETTISKVKEIFDAEDPMLIAAILANVDACRLASKLTKRANELESRISELNTQLDLMVEILMKNSPPKNVKEERRRDWPTLKMVIGI